MFRSAVCLISAGLLAAQSAPDPAATARKALDLMLGGKYQEMNQMFTPDGQKVYSLDSLSKMGSQIKSWGSPNIGSPSVARPGPNFVVTIPVGFATQNINFMIAVNPEGKLAVFLERPGEVAWQRPAYVKADAFHERAVTVGDGEWKLPGVLAVPVGNGPFPAVVLVHDSGPNDRDETVFGTKPFRDLAEGLASRGIVVLRYEKRTRQYAARIANKPKVTLRDETGDDALKALALVRAQPEVNPQKVYLLGHGLGGYLAPRIAEEDGKVAGIIVLDAHARPLEDVMLDQAVEAISTRTDMSADAKKKELDAAKAAAARVKALEPADSDSPPIMGMSAAMILDLKGYDPAANAKGLTARVLVLQGERDFQTTMKDFNLWKTGLAGRKDTAFHSYPALNHLMVAGQGKSTEAEYRKPGHVAPEVVDDIAKWVAQ
jgi:dienelactone hydrolase